MASRPRQPGKPRRQSFYSVLSEAMADMLKHGYDSQYRLDDWISRLKTAARESLVPEAVLERNLKELLLRTYERTTNSKKLLQRHSGIPPWTLEQIKPKLRGELDRRILASANLITLNREASIQRTLQRFAGWATAIPTGGAPQATRAEQAKTIRKGIASLPFEERRVVIDQGHKLVNSIDEILAQDGGAIAAVWMHVKEIGYDERPWHRKRDGEVFVFRGNWALEQGLVKLAGHTYVDAIVDAKGRPDGPSVPVYCRCLPGSTRIPLANVQVVYRRSWNGILLKISTASGKALYLTPNHPVLSAKGWVAADSLNVGDDVGEIVGKDVKPSPEIDEYDGVPTIAEIFDLVAPSGVSCVHKGAANQFHGDGCADSDVDTVASLRTLRIDAHSRSLKSGDKLRLAKPDLAKSAFGTTRKHRLGFLLAATGAAHCLAAMSARFLGLVLEIAASNCLACFAGLRRLVLEAYTGSFDSVPNVNPRLTQSLSDDRRADAVSLSERGGGNTVLVALGDFVDRKIKPFSEMERGLRLVSDVDARLPQSATDGGVGHLKALGKVHGIDARAIRFSKLIDIERVPFSGHVFNLQTEDGWYAAEGIVTHNCSWGDVLYTLDDIAEVAPDMLTEKGKAAIAKADQVVNYGSATYDTARFGT